MTSKTRSGPGEHMRAVGAEARNALGMIRRMAVTLTSRAFWQVAGHRLLDGTIETRDAEVFSGVGFYARPPADGNPEAIVAFVGGAGSPIVIAVRDEKTRQAVAGAIAAGETAVFNSSSLVLIKADGTIEIRSAAGLAAPLATKADLEALKLAITNAVIVANDGGASLKSTILGALASWPAGTTKLKAE